MDIKTQNRWFVLNKETNTIIATTTNKTQLELMLEIFKKNYDVVAYKQKVITGIK